MITHSYKLLAQSSKRGAFKGLTAACMFANGANFCASMSADERSLSVSCGCTCQPEDDHAVEAEKGNSWARCDCILCGNGCCNVRVDDSVKFGWWVIRLGGSPDAHKQIEASPKFCGSCGDYHYLKLQQDGDLGTRAKKRTSTNCSSLDVEAIGIDMSKHRRMLGSSDVKTDKADEFNQ